MKLPGASSINQLAYVVQSIDTAVEWWTSVMGIGPFIVSREIVFERSDYLGHQQPVTYAAALAFSGEINVELIEPNGESIFNDWLLAGRTGVNHVCVFTEDYATTEAELLARGGKRLQGGTIGGGLVGFYEMGGDQSVILELAQLAPATLAMFDAAREASRTWDGISHFLEDGITSTLTSSKT